MELALSLGDRPKPLSFLEKLPSNNNNNNNNNNNKMMMVSSVSTKDVVGFCMALGGKKDDHQQAAARSADVSCSDDHIHKEDDDDDDEDRGSSDPPPNLQLHLLPFSPPVQTSPPPPPPQFSGFPWLTDNLAVGVAGAGGGMGGCSSNIIGKKEEKVEGELGRGTAMSSPNSTSAAAAASSCFQMDFSMYNIVMYNNRSTSSNNNMNMNMNMKKRDRFEESNQININNYNNEIMETAAETTGASTDEDENNIISNNNNINEGGRKKLRLTKDQSAFLEDSFKVHSTLNPKQKQALAKQLNLRPRQVEVWFQNRRARTKLKQTEIDCEYLKRCCDKLTEENRKLQKELQELRALKSSQPFYMQLPATTLTMCPSCERVATTTTTTAANTAATPPPATTADGGNSTRVVIAKPIRAIPFSPADSLILDHHHDTTQTHISL